MYIKDETKTLVSLIAILQKAILNFAKSNAKIIIPGKTIDLNLKLMLFTQRSKLL
jgi:argininosuccinate lyase